MFFIYHALLFFVFFYLYYVYFGWEHCIFIFLIED